ncbi:hypothetical protein FHG87_014705 [Trinorchestia longiramus]|nr:hypothetical protein FHG87_014705 [Trinorchestia longiramus]
MTPRKPIKRPPQMYCLLLFTPSFLEVLQCVVQDSAISLKLFEERWPELKEALQEAGATYTWRDLVLRWSDDLNVVKRVAEAAKSSDSEWLCRNGRDLDAVALMLPHEQPDLLRVWMHPRDLRNTRWAEVIQHRQGRLELQMEIKESCDDVLAPLRNSNGRCTLDRFSGTISTASGLADLASAVTSSTELYIRMTTPLPLGTHRMKECRKITVHTTVLDADTGSEGSVKLPARSSVRLVLEELAFGSWEVVSNTMLALAPPGGRYKELELEYRSTDNEYFKKRQKDVDRVLVVLQGRGVRTEDQRPTRWSWNGNLWAICNLSITDDLPKHLLGVRDLLALRDDFIKLSVNRPEQLRAEWPALRDGLQAAGACCLDWQDLMLRCAGFEDLARVAAAATLAEAKPEDVWYIRTRRDAAVVKLMLPHGQPSRLEVNMPPYQLKGAHWEQMAGDWEQVAGRWEGELWLDLPHCTPCDDLLATLQGKRSQLRHFNGAIAAADSVATLSSVAVPASSLNVHLLTPLSLSALQGRCRCLNVSMHTLGAADKGVWPLPAQPSPHLRVKDVFRVPWIDLVKTVLAYAPHNNRYLGITLEPSTLGCRDLNWTVAALQQHGIRTLNSDRTDWSEHEMEPLYDIRHILHLKDDIP